MPKILESPKEKILYEAKLMLKEQGYRELSMRILAKNCGIGLGTVYNYFQNKHSIVLEIVRNDWKDVIFDLKDINSLDIDIKEKMSLIYSGLSNYFSDHIDIFFELYKEEKSKPDHNMASILGSLYEITDDIILYHKNKGDINIPLDDRTLSKFIISNMITIIKSRAFSFEELMCILNFK